MAVQMLKMVLVLLLLDMANAAIFSLTTGAVASAILSASMMFWEYQQLEGQTEN